MCTISSSGLDFNSDITDNWDTSSIADAILQYGTRGLIGFKDGQITAGVTTRAVDESLGEVTGRNVARKQAMQTQDAINEAKIQAEKERQFNIQKQEAQERQASGQAASNAKRADAGGTGSSGTNSVEQQMAVDFLGL